MASNKINRIQTLVNEIDTLDKEIAGFDAFVVEATERSQDGLTVVVTLDKIKVPFDLTTIQNVCNREKNQRQNRIDALEAKLTING